MKKPFIAGNWKMYKNSDEAASLVQTIKAAVHKRVAGDVVLCPPFTALPAVARLLKDTPFELGAQNMHYESEGAFTGEISPLMLKEFGCRYVILGHSERRQHFKEDDVLINKKIKTAVKYSLIPILCIGETLEQREARQFFETVKEQFTECMKGLTGEDASKVVIAYEPVWAIGTGKTASPDQAEQMHSYIRKLLDEKYGAEIAVRVPILYGGSVKPDNIGSLMQKPNVDGALVGGASLKAESFSQIVINAVEACEAEVNS